MNRPNPALVAQRAVQRLPRVPLLLLCAAYVLPGVFGRDPWKNADIAAVGYMLELARGHTSWLAPTLAGAPAEGGLLPYWLGAGAIQLLGPWMDAALAARIPFALLLAATLALVWYAGFHLARTDAAQPLPFAFGGEADRIDYARALADGGLLSLIACLGLLQLGHETTPELVQLSACTLVLYALAAAPYRPRSSRAAVLAALPALAASGAPTTAMLYGLAGLAVCARSDYPLVRHLVRWLLAAMALAAVMATALGAWAWRLDGASPWNLPRLMLWFAWPVWPLATWTLWQWRRHLMHRHVAVPLGLGLVALLCSASMGGNDRALMLALPPMALLGAFALPTLKRSVSAALDWFSVFFFSASGLVVWVMYIAIQTGVPAKPAANAARLLPGFEPQFHAGELLAAVLASVAWAALVRWRTGRHRPALWKSLVIPAGGVALSWLLLMTLMLPMLDYARSYRPTLQRLSEGTALSGCVHAPNLSRAQVAGLVIHVGVSVQRQIGNDCRWMVYSQPIAEAPPQMVDGRPVEVDWRLVKRVRRPTDKQESLLLYARR